MNLQHFPARCAVSALGVLLALPTLSSLSAQSKRPNLLVVVTDDQRFDQLGCAGHPVLQTPQMDALAKGGVRFTNAFVTTAICAASRASIMVSRTEGHHGYTFGKPPISRALANESYFRLLKNAGYRAPASSASGA